MQRPRGRMELPRNSRGAPRAGRPPSPAPLPAPPGSAQQSPKHKPPSHPQDGGSPFAAAPSLRALQVPTCPAWTLWTTPASSGTKQALPGPPRTPAGPAQWPASCKGDSVCSPAARAHGEAAVDLTVASAAETHFPRSPRGGENPAHCRRSRRAPRPSHHCWRRTGV